jgi:hypothetical protein
MPDSFKHIPFGDAKKTEEIDALLQEHLKISLNDCHEALSNSLQKRAEEMAAELTSLAPYGDYGKLTEDPEIITTFLREEATKLDNWKIEFLEVKSDKDQLMELVFHNKAVDDGDILKGFVFIGLSGKIRHAFPQINS